MKGGHTMRRPGATVESWAIIGQRGNYLVYKLKTNHFRRKSERSSVNRLDYSRVIFKGNPEINKNLTGAPLFFGRI